MERRYYSRQNYNQLKIRQYEEYVKKLNRYYIYMKRNYEEYIKKQNQQYMYMKKYYEEYIKKQNQQYIYLKNHYEDYIKSQNKYYLYYKKYDEENNKIDNAVINNTQNEYYNFIKTINIEDSTINAIETKKSISEFSEVKIKENNLEYKKDDLPNYNHLENDSNTCSIDSYKGNLLDEIYEELCEENDKSFIEESDEELLEQNDKKFVEENVEEFIEEKDKKLIDLDYNNVVEEEASKINNIPIEGIYANLPVVLAETNITISVEDTITLDKEVNEIKLIKMNVFLTKSRLIPLQSSISEPNCGILFVTGFIRNNIKYEAKTFTEDGVENSYGNIKYCIVEVPFNFTTRITYIRPPIFTENNAINELEFNGVPKVSDVYKDSVIECFQYEPSFVFTEVFNEKPFVELVKATFIEVNINKNPILDQETTSEQEFTRIKERIIVNLTLSVLQKQQLRVEIE